MKAQKTKITEIHYRVSYKKHGIPGTLYKYFEGPKALTVGLADVYWDPDVERDTVEVDKDFHF